MNTRRTLRKAVAGLLKQTVANGPAAPASSDRKSTDASVDSQSRKH
ncbi:hypothetical protein L0152_30285 [bacterium]|nr:hypothetical protein [bacterium]